jgi:hypothetical protein
MFASVSVGGLKAKNNCKKIWRTEKFSLSLFYQKQSTMKIDVEPIVEKAEGIDVTILKLRNESSYYVIRLANGNNYTVKWTLKELEEFQPNKTVSEMIKSWEENILRRYEVAKTALETGLHPTRRLEVLDQFKRPTGEIVKKPLDLYEKAGFKREMTDREKEFGSMKFIRIDLEN